MSEWLIYALRLAFIVLAYLPAVLLPAVSDHERFPTRREIIAVLVLVFLLVPTVGLTAVSYGLAGPFCVFFLSAFTVGIAGRRPFLYGVTVSLIYLLCYLWCLRVNGILPDLATEWRFFLLCFVVAPCSALIGCLPLYLKWWWNARHP